MNLQTGDSVYVWKKSGGRDCKPRYYHWTGRGVVIGNEGRSAIWVSLNGFITKAPPEAVTLTSEEEKIAITEVDDVLKRTQQQFRPNQEVSFEDLVEPVEEILREELKRAFDQNKKDQLDFKIQEDKHNHQELSQVNEVYQEIINVSNQRQSSDKEPIEVDEGTPPPESDRSSRSRGQSKSRF